MTARPITELFEESGEEIDLGLSSEDYCEEDTPKHHSLKKKKRGKSPVDYTQEVFLKLRKENKEQRRKLRGFQRKFASMEGLPSPVPFATSTDEIVVVAEKKEDSLLYPPLDLNDPKSMRHHIERLEEQNKTIDYHLSQYFMKYNELKDENERKDKEIREVHHRMKKLRVQNDVLSMKFKKASDFREKELEKQKKRKEKKRRRQVAKSDSDEESEESESSSDHEEEEEDEEDGAEEEGGEERSSRSSSRKTITTIEETEEIRTTNSKEETSRRSPRDPLRLFNQSNSSDRPQIQVTHVGRTLSADSETLPISRYPFDELRKRVGESTRFVEEDENDTSNNKKKDIGPPSKLTHNHRGNILEELSPSDEDSPPSESIPKQNIKINLEEEPIEEEVQQFDPSSSSVRSPNLYRSVPNTSVSSQGSNPDVFRMNEFLRRQMETQRLEYENKIFFLNKKFGKTLDQERDEFNLKTSRYRQCILKLQQDLKEKEAKRIRMKERYNHFREDLAKKSREIVTRYNHKIRENEERNELLVLEIQGQKEKIGVLKRTKDFFSQKVKKMKEKVDENRRKYLNVLEKLEVFKTRSRRQMDEKYLELKRKYDEDLVELGRYRRGEEKESNNQREMDELRRDNRKQRSIISQLEEEKNQLLVDLNNSDYQISELDNRMKGMSIDISRLRKENSSWKKKEKKRREEVEEFKKKAKELEEDNSKVREKKAKEEEGLERLYREKIKKLEGQNTSEKRRSEKYKKVYRRTSQKYKDLKKRYREKRNSKKKSKTGEGDSSGGGTSSSEESS